MKENEEINVINIQLIALVVTLFSGILSLIITYNQKIKLEEKKQFHTPEELLSITYFNRILIILISLVFLYVNYKLYEISKEQKENLKPYTLQIIASILTVIAGIIALYVVTLSSTETVADVENPII